MNPAVDLEHDPTYAAHPRAVCVLHVDVSSIQKEAHEDALRRRVRVERAGAEWGHMGQRREWADELVSARTEAILMGWTSGGSL